MCHYIHMQLDWALKMVSSHSKAAKATNRTEHRDLMQRQYRQYEALLLRAQPRQYSFTEEAPTSIGDVDSGTTEVSPGEADCVNAVLMPIRTAFQFFLSILKCCIETVIPSLNRGKWT
jgi:hypothetical protein